MLIAVGHQPRVAGVRIKDNGKLSHQNLTRASRALHSLVWVISKNDG